MKIEKGKLYYDIQDDRVRLANEVLDSEYYSNKVAVHCPTEEDLDYVVSKGYNLIEIHNFYGGFFQIDGNGWCNDDGTWYENKNFHIISIETFKQFYPPISKEEQKELIVELSNSESYYETYSWVNNNISKDEIKYEDVFNDKNYELAKEAISSEISKRKDMIVQNVVNKHQERSEVDVFNPQLHYDNSKGSLYKVATERKWNSYQFDIVKRIDRALKKGQFKQDLQKTKDLIDLWLREESN